MLTLLVESSTDYAMILTDPERRILRWSAGAERLFGWTEAEVSGSSLDRIFTPEDRQAGEPAREANEAARDRKASDERWHLRRDGSRFWGSGMLRSLHDSAGNLRGFAKVLRDATQRHQADTAAAEDRRVTLALQHSLLVTPLRGTFPGLHVATIYEPASHEALVGGDFFDAFALAGGRVALVVGDVTGKGLLAATYMAEVKFALRAFLRESPHPARALDRLNHFLLEGKRLDTPPHEEYVAISVAVLDTATGALECSWAGMDPPVLIRPAAAPAAPAGVGVDGDGEDTGERVLGETPYATPLQGGATYLCVAEDTDFDTVRVVLSPGDLLMITTDGVTEARQGRNVPLFGLEGVAQTVNAIAAASHGRGEASAGDEDPEGQEAVFPPLSLPPALRDAETLARAVVEAARAFAGGVMHDDVCLVIARRTIATEITTVTEE